MGNNIYKIIGPMPKGNGNCTSKSTFCLPKIDASTTKIPYRNQSQELSLLAGVSHLRISPERGTLFN